MSKRKPKIDDLINWPAEPFTIPQVVGANSYLEESLVREVISKKIDKGILRVMTPIPNRGHIKLRHQFEHEMRENKRPNRTEHTI